MGRNDDYRVRMFDSESCFILKLSADQKSWAQQCASEPIKVQGTYKDGGIVEVGHLGPLVPGRRGLANGLRVQSVPAITRPASLAADPRPALHGAQHTWNMRHRYGFRHGGTSGWSAENIAAGQPDAHECTHTWYNSGGHRANMLNPNYSYIGVGYYNGMWTQQFR